MVKAEEWLIESARERASEFGDHLRKAKPSDAIPNLNWSVADLGQHLACLPSYWRSRNAEGVDATQPSDFAGFSDSARAHITSQDVDELAALIETEFGAFLDELTEWNDVFWIFGTPVSASQLAAIAINEFIVHGRDLAAATGQPLPRHTSQEALAAAEATLVMAPAFVDATKAKSQPDGVYHVRFRGGGDWTWEKRGGELLVGQGKPPKVDAHLFADPEAFVLSSLGRIGQITPALTGKTIAYGRKPWRLLGLGKIVADGV